MASSSSSTVYRYVSTPDASSTSELFLQEEEDLTSISNNSHVKSLKSSKRSGFRYLARKPFRIYWNYVTRLWVETSTDARKRISQDKAAEAIRAIQNLMKEEEYLTFPTGDSLVARERLLEACREMLLQMVTTHQQQQTTESKSLSSSSSSKKKKKINQKSQSNILKPERKRRSILFGATMGFFVACWVFSGNWIFTGIFTLMTILGQLEYYRMVINTGVYPARKISVVGACSMFLTALFAPNLHQICLPIFGLWSMIWFLTMRRQVTSIPEIATTFTGMFYLGYVPSFWVRTRLFGIFKEPTRLAPITGPMLKFLGSQAETLPNFIPQAIHLPITQGSIFIFWTWLCLAFADVGAYFVGRSHGTTKLGTIFPAAGATSPNKTVEGFMGGCVVSMAIAILGAWVQKWPYWFVTGTIHGCLLALLGLIGDLTASMLKRDAGLKDFGDLIPEHGGIMDRVDSFIWSAPYSWLVCVYVIPALKAFATKQSII